MSKIVQLINGENTRMLKLVQKVLEKQIFLAATKQNKNKQIKKPLNKIVGSGVKLVISIKDNKSEVFNQISFTICTQN